MLGLFSQELKEIAQALLSNNITLNEAQDALAVVRVLEKAGIPKPDWQRLTKATGKLSDAEFREAALKLLRLEEAAGMEYERAIAYFQELEADIVLKRGKKQELNQKIATANQKVKELGQQVKELTQTAGQQKIKTEEILKAEGLTRAEIEQFGRIRAELESKGLTMSVFIPIAKEFAGSKDFTKEIATRLKKTDSLTKTQKEIKTENHELEARSASLKSQVNELSRKRDGLATDIVKLDKQVAGERESLAALKQERAVKRQQYDFFGVLLAIFSGGTPYQDSTPEKLTSAVLKLAQGWYAGRPIEELRGIFITAVCGDYLHSIQCDNCSARFVVDRAANSYNKYQEKYYCPVCHFRSYTKPNEDFVKAMFSEKEFNRCSELQLEVERLKPLEVFLDIPCNSCGKPLTNNWTREEVVGAFKTWGHKSCR